MGKFDRMAIFDHYKSLGTKQRIKFRDEVLEITGISYSSFYNKMSGFCKFTNSEIIVINSIIRKHHVEQG